MIPYVPYVSFLFFNLVLINCFVKLNLVLIVVSTSLLCSSVFICGATLIFAVYFDSILTRPNKYFDVCPNILCKGTFCNWFPLWFIGVLTYVGCILLSPLVKPVIKSVNFRCLKRVWRGLRSNQQVAKFLNYGHDYIC